MYAYAPNEIVTITNTTADAMMIAVSVETPPIGAVVNGVGDADRVGVETGVVTGVGVEVDVGVCNEVGVGVGEGVGVGC